MAETVVARRYVLAEEDADQGERDALIEVESSDTEIDLHIDPRHDDVVTVSLKPSQAWQLARELARAATEAEQP